MTIDLQLEAEDQIAVLTIQRPDALNALNLQVLQDVMGACRQLADSPARCVIVTGAGQRAFVAGADIAEMQTMTRAEASRFSGLGNQMMRMVAELPMPTIAAVNGFALGGGCELALACDLRYASTKAAFGLPEVGLGITPGFGGTQRLARTIGIGQAKELIFSAERINAERALRIGLVNAVVEPDELLPQVRELARRIAANSPVGVRAAKTAIALGSQTDLVTGLGIEAAMFGGCFECDDQRQAMAAFVAKRERAPFSGKC